MNRRQGLIKLIGGFVGISGLSGCAVGASDADSQIVSDDGVVNITPAYLVTATEGSPTAFVRADFYLMQEKKIVRLKSEGGISVNGVLLTPDLKTPGSYIANIPFYGDGFNFAFTRSKGQTQLHHFALPKLMIASYPLRYSGSGSIVVPFESDQVGAEVVRDRYSMTIYAPTGEFRLDVEGVSSSKITFRPLQVVPLPPGTYRARIFRVQRISLSKISDQKSGWAALSYGRNFNIEVTA